jgi:sugar-specific transcriptional regulator TrmB
MGSMIQDEHTQTLMGFGLTFLQAKTYLALAKLGKADVKTIAKASNVVRQDIYRAMSKLQKQGLVIKVVANPTIYKATPIKEGISILLQKRKKESAELQEKTTSLINDFHTKNFQIAISEENIEFTINSKMKLTRKIHNELSQKAQTSIDIAAPLKAVDIVLFYSLEYFKQAMKRGVKIRVLTQKGDEKSTLTKPRALANPLFELRFLSTNFNLGMHIFDRKEMTLCISEEGDITSLHSTNPTFVELASNYYNEIWNKAQE